MTKLIINELVRSNCSTRLVPIDTEHQAAPRRRFACLIMIVFGELIWIGLNQLITQLQSF